MKLGPTTVPGSHDQLVALPEGLYRRVVGFQVGHERLADVS